MANDPYQSPNIGFKIPEYKNTFAEKLRRYQLTEEFATDEKKKKIKKRNLGGKN